MATWPTLNVYADLAGTLSNPADPRTAGDWTNIGTYVQSGSIVRGASRADGFPIRYEAGTSSLQLKNTDARFDPLNTAGPYYGQIFPRREYAVQALWSGTHYKLWRGFAEEWKPTYPLHGKDARVQLRGADALSIFANADGNGNPSFNDTTGGRVGEWRDAIDATWLHGGISTQGTVIQADASLSGNALAGMLLAVDTELGELYMGADGFIEFRLRNEILTDARSNTSNGTFNTGATLPFQDVTVSYDADQVRNYISIARVGGTAQVEFDQGSIDAYQKRSYTRTDLLHTTDAESTDYAGYILHLLKDAELRIDSITIDPQSAPATLFPQVLTRELGDRITVAFTPVGGTAISRDCFIRGISHSIGKASWQTKWTLQDASRFNFLVFDHATLGKLDSNALGY